MARWLWNRRKFLADSTRLAVAGAIVPTKGNPRVPRLRVSKHLEPVSPAMLRDPKIKAFALNAVNAAKDAGAQYADVRLTYDTTRTFTPFNAPVEVVTLGVSARALVDGYWGWAARPDLVADAAPWVGREAVRLAKANAVSGTPRAIELGTIPVVKDGVWTTPIQTDPFEMALEETVDWLAGVDAWAQAFGTARGDPNAALNQNNIAFVKQERVFASSEGSYITQTVYTAIPNFVLVYKNVLADVSLNGFTQAGWECLSNTTLEERIRREVDRIDAYLALPTQTFDVGRYDLVLSADVMRVLLMNTLGGAATELERVLGYKANREGTSYLGPDPLAFLGTAVASPLVTITAERSTPQSVATVRWDDEGVAPDDFTLVKDGVLMDYQTTREQAAWIAPWYQKHGMPIRSHGLAVGSSAIVPPTQAWPNITLQPRGQQGDIDDLVASVDTGIAAEGVNASIVNSTMDFQCLNGVGPLDRATKIRRGRKVARLSGAPALMFRTPELWKSVLALGGRSSQLSMGIFQCTVNTVPAIIKQQALVNYLRKA